MQPEDHIDEIIHLVMTVTGEDIVEDIKSDISTVYPPASKEGDPPHFRTGDLYRGIEFEVQQAGAITTLTVTSSMPYSIFLEEGTTRMRARPFMIPSRDKWEPLILQRFTGAFGHQSTLISNRS